MESIVIPLTQGKSTIIDADMSHLLEFKWHAALHSGIWYAERGVGKKKIFLHREITGAPDGMLVDHISGDGLDNRGSNLRVVGPSENMLNSKMSTKNSSGYRGVSFCKQTGRWRAQVQIDKKPFRLGRFDTAEAASAAYLDAVKNHLPEFETYRCSR